MDECVKSKLVHLSNQTTPKCNGEGWVVVNVARFGTLYLLPFITGVFLCEVSEFYFYFYFFLVEEGFAKL